MSVATDMADSWQYVEDVEEVTLTPKNPDGTPVASVKAKRRVMNKTTMQQFAAVGIEPTDIPIHLWASTLGATVPKQGDWITDSGGTVYRIISLSLESLRNRWRCLCRRNV